MMNARHGKMIPASWILNQMPEIVMINMTTILMMMTILMMISMAILMKMLTCTTLPMA